MSKIEDQKMSESLSTWLNKSDRDIIYVAMGTVADPSENFFTKLVHFLI